MELLKLITTYVFAALLSTSADAISPILIGMKGSTSIYYVAHLFYFVLTTGIKLGVGEGGRGR